MKHIPNIFTLSNLFFGCCSIVFALQSQEALVQIEKFNQIVYLPEKIWLASLFIGIASIMDFLDGFVARFFKATSLLGKQLDSLSDVVSFGVAPGVILYQLLRTAFAHRYTSLDYNWFFLSPAFLVACFAAYRLGKFNLDDRQTTYFVGMPTPIVAIFVASLPLMVWTNQFNLNFLILNIWFLYFLIFILCYLMISEIKFISLKFKKGIKNNILPMFIFISFVLAFIIFRWVGIAMAWLLYTGINIVFQNKIFKQIA